MKVIFDAGAFLALERDDRGAWRRFKLALKHGVTVVTHGGVIGQVWRGGGPRQALLARALARVKIVPLDEELGRSAGQLLAQSGADDVIDAAVVLLASEGDEIVSSDVGDLEALVVARDIVVDFVPV